LSFLHLLLDIGETGTADPESKATSGEGLESKWWPLSLPRCSGCLWLTGIFEDGVCVSLRIGPVVCDGPIHEMLDKDDVETLGFARAHDLQGHGFASDSIADERGELGRVNENLVFELEQDVFLLESASSCWAVLSDEVHHKPGAGFEVETAVKGFGNRIDPDTEKGFRDFFRESTSGEEGDGKEADNRVADL